MKFCERQCRIGMYISHSLKIYHQILVFHKFSIYSPAMNWSLTHDTSSFRSFCDQCYVWSDVRYNSETTDSTEPCVYYISPINMYSIILFLSFSPIFFSHFLSVYLCNYTPLSLSLFSLIFFTSLLSSFLSNTLYPSRISSPSPTITPTLSFILPIVFLSHSFTHWSFWGLYKIMEKNYTDIGLWVWKQRHHKKKACLLGTNKGLF